jgi:hypothetical protein
VLDWEVILGHPRLGRRPGVTDQSINQSIKQLPARRRIGVLAYSDGEPPAATTLGGNSAPLGSLTSSWPIPSKGVSIRFRAVTGVACWTYAGGSLVPLRASFSTPHGDLRPPAQAELLYTLFRLRGEDWHHAL